MSATKYFSMSVAELKSLLNIDSIEIYINENPKSETFGGKSFRVMSEDGTPMYFRVARDFDGSKPAVFITSKTDEDGNPDWLSGALVNNTPTHSLFCKV